MQATKFLAPQNIAPTFKVGNLGQPKYMPLMQQGNGGGADERQPAGRAEAGRQQRHRQARQWRPDRQPAGRQQSANQQNGTPSQTPGKIVTLPAPTNTTTNNGGIGKIVTLPATNNTQNGGSNNAGTANGKTNGTPGKIVSMPVNVGKGGTTVDTKPVVQTQNNPIRVNNGVKLNNNPVNKVQVQNNRRRSSTRPTGWSTTAATTSASR